MALAAVAVMLTGCKEQKLSETIITKLPEKKAPLPTQTLGDYEQTTPVEWGGSKYNVVVKREADASLPLVDDGSGTKYYDNHVLVRVLRADGSEMFAKKFVKSDFVNYVDPLYRKNGALLGVVFDRAEEGFLYFAASVGSPDKMSDEYEPLVVKLNRSGSISIAKDTHIDLVGDGHAAAESSEEEDDGV